MDNMRDYENLENHEQIFQEALEKGSYHDLGGTGKYDWYQITIILQKGRQNSCNLMS